MGLIVVDDGQLSEVRWLKSSKKSCSEDIVDCRSHWYKRKMGKDDCSANILGVWT